MVAQPAKYSAHEIANYFLSKAQEDQQELFSNLKLQKLVYYAQGLHLAAYGSPLFNEKIEAWTYGPVVPDLYHDYKQYGASGIPADEKFDPSAIDPDTQAFLDEVYQALGQFSAFRLTDLAHSDQCWTDAKAGEEITQESMKTSLKKYLKNG